MLSGKARHQQENKICDPFIGNLRTNKNQSVMKELRKWEGEMTPKGDVGTVLVMVLVIVMIEISYKIVRIIESNIKHQCVLMYVNYTSNFKNKKVRYPLVSFSGFSISVDSFLGCIFLLTIPPLRLSKIVHFMRSGTELASGCYLELCACMHSAQAYFL